MAKEGAFTLTGFETPEQVRQRIGKTQMAETMGMFGGGSFNDKIFAAAMGGGQMIGQGIAGALGYESPEEKIAKNRQQVMSGLDFTNKDSVLEAARKASELGDTQLHLMLADRAMQMTPEEGKAPKTITVPVNGEEVTYQWTGKGWQEIARGTKGAATQVNIAGEQAAFEKELGKEQARIFAEEQKAAEDAAKSIVTNTQAKNILDSGTITGFGANFMVGVGKMASQLGFNFAKDEVENAQAYGSLMAQQTAQIIKAFGAGTGLSDADREYALKAAGGDITMDEGAIRKILALNVTASQNIIKKYNRKASLVEKKMNFPFPLQVVMPNIPEGLLKPIEPSLVPEVKTETKQTPKIPTGWSVNKVP